MDREKLTTFIHAAEADLASVRRDLLVLLQGDTYVDISTLRQILGRLRVSSFENLRPGLAVLADECDKAVGRLSSQDTPPAEIYASLDIVAKLEADLLKIRLNSPGFMDDVDQLVETSFRPTGAVPQDEARSNEFEIDAETFEIYRAEAADLLANINRALKKLVEIPGDQNSLWEIRRNAHTLKGASGIVGLEHASAIAHQMEDLLDKMVESRTTASPEVVDFLEAASRHLEMMSLASDRGSVMPSAELQERYNAIIGHLSTTKKTEERTQSRPQDVPAAPPEGRIESIKPAGTPIVRVALDRLDDLIRLSHMLSLNRSSIAERMSESGSQKVDPRSLNQLFDTQYALISELQSKLQRIRMVRFVTLETRLARAVHVTCLDTGKKAVLEIENGEAEVDTQMIDALVEPLLHLLKNAVVHGIEPPEMRRLIGKPEKGRIIARIVPSQDALVLSVMDDGRGIALLEVKEKAVANGVVSRETADSMTETELLALIFNRGLTTAEKVDLNAGRGVGMSIVKEAIEARGGSVSVASRPQAGTTFTIVMPLVEPRPFAVKHLEKRTSDNPHAPLILIVDDSATIRRQLQAVVEEAGYRSITSENGADALELLLNGTVEPDLILSDVEMPQIDGWTLLEYIKTDENLGTIPVVMITSLKAAEHRDLALNLGASDLVEKPFGAADVVRVVKEYAGVAPV